MTYSTLILLPYNPGDVIMALQAIGQLKSRWPQIAFSFIVSDECQTLVQDSPLIEKTWVLPRRALKNLTSLERYSEAIAMLENFIQSLTAMTFDLALNFFQEDFGGVLQSLVIAKRKAGLELGSQGQYKIESRLMQYLAAIPVAREKNGWHTVDIFIRTATHEILALEIPPSVAIKPGQRSLLNILPKRIMPELGHALEKGSYLVFHPGSAWLGKRWPEIHWARLARLCTAEGKTVVFTGSPEERPILDRIQALLAELLMECAANPAMQSTQASGKLVDAVGKTSLLEAAYLIENAKIVVTGDTVAMHLAAALQIPTLSLFGPSNPIETGPYGSGHILFQTFPLPQLNLAFAFEHEGLTTLQPESLIPFLYPDRNNKSMEGNNPHFLGAAAQHYRIWQTEWSWEENMQILTDSQRLFHPSFVDSLPLRQILDQEITPEAATRLNNHIMPEFNDANKIKGTRKDLYLALHSSLESLDQNSFFNLERYEKALAQETQNSIIWESYRIGINGIDIPTIPMYLKNRITRFLEALMEETHCPGGLGS